MRNASHLRCAILQLLRESRWRSTHRGFGSGSRARLRWTRSAAHPTSRDTLAGERNSALRGSRLDLHSRTNAALPDGLGSRRAFRELAIHFSAVRTLLDRWIAGAIWRRAPGPGLGTFSVRAVGAHARLGHRILGVAAAPIWHGAWHLHHLGAAARAFRPRVRAPFAGLLVRRASTGHSSGEILQYLERYRRLPRHSVMGMMVMRGPGTKSRANDDGVFVGSHGVLHVGRNKQVAADGIGLEVLEIDRVAETDL